MSTTTIRPATYAADASIPRFSVAKYQKMISSGGLDDEDHVELLEGCVVLKMARDPEHDGTIHVILQALTPLIPPGWTARIQAAITLDDSQPEPDIILARGTPRDFLSRHPEASEIGLAIEVANTSLQRDRIDKSRIYARVGIPIYWVVNLIDGQIEVFSSPSGPGIAPAYGSTQTYFRSDLLPLSVDGVEVGQLKVVDLLP